MSRILLINPHSPDYLTLGERYLPLGLMYLSSYLKQYGGHETMMIDFQVIKGGFVSRREPYDMCACFEDGLRRKVLDFAPDVIGVSVHYSGRFAPALEAAAMLRRDFPDTPIVFGGIHPTIFPRDILDDCEEVDFILQGESEQSFLHLVELLESGRGELSGVDGLAYREGGEIHCNPKLHFIDDVDSLPFPDYDLVNLSDYYFDTSRWYNPKGLEINVSLYIISSRSCPRQCTFCSMFMVHGKKYRMRSAKNVVDEVQWLYEKYNHRYFSFMDDNLTLNRSRILEICAEIKRRGLDIQFDTPNGLEINSLDAEVLDAMVDAGLIRVCLAVESGSPEIRASVNKKLSQEKIFEVFRLIRERPVLAFNVFFIIGFPNETRETLQQTAQLIEDLGLKRCILSFATPFPGTKLFRECVENGLIDMDLHKLHRVEKFVFISEYPMIKPYRLSRDEIVDFRNGIYRKLNMLDYLIENRKMK